MSKLYVVSVGRNAGKFVLNCVKSVANQTLKPDSHILVDDISDDDTRLYLKSLPTNGLTEVIFNTERKYRAKNIYDNAINKNSEDIICIVDSDDWLNEVTALEEIKEVYDKTPNLEFVYTNYIFSSGERGNNQAIPDSNWNPYTGQWITSHMCTFKVKALERVNVSNFLGSDGNWFKMATDHALTLPMLYKSREKHGDYSAVKFLDRALYCYLFEGNPAKPRTGPKGEELGRVAGTNSSYIKQRGYVSN